MSNQRIRQPMQTEEETALGYANTIGKTPRSVRKYDTANQGTTLVPAGLYPQQVFFDQDGNEIVMVKGQRPGTIPKRAHAQKPAANPSPTTDSTKAAPVPRVGFTKERVIVILLLGMAIALLLLWGATTIVNWWTDTQNDWTYTKDFRTYSVDQAVGHNGDSPDHPSHFIIQNDKGYILIIELPADDPKKALLITGTTLIGADREPVTVTFRKNTDSGRLDLILHVQGQQIVCMNDGQKFNPPTG